MRFSALVSLVGVVLILPACGGSDATGTGPSDGGADASYHRDAVVPNRDAMARTDSGDPTQEDPICGNGSIEMGETCDDGNARPADGCSGICLIEPNYVCPEEGMPCELDSECGNNIIEPGEGCDDGGFDLMDGCDDSCQVEMGWACNAGGCMRVESVECGDGRVGFGEQCDDVDDGMPMSNDGCSDTCQVEPGFRCLTPGEPCEELITEFCGDGVVNGSDEECDDQNRTPQDGCSPNCEVEAGYVCDATGCAVDCGDGLVVGEEACDDGNEMPMDGCAADCGTIEPGYVCPIAAGVGGACVEVTGGAVCPNGILDFGEECDDGNNVDMDGCTGCNVDDGFRCPRAGNTCERLPRCGDGFVDLEVGEQCDDGDTPPAGGDGCSTTCQVEAGFRCPRPTLQSGRLRGGNCAEIVCGDGTVEGAEECDDGGRASGDGCSPSCTVEPGWVCPPTISCRSASCGDGVVAGLEACDNGSENGTGNPVSGIICSASCQLLADPNDCGNGFLDPGEACDDGNNDLGDGCTVFCQIEPTCNPPGPCTSECGDGIVFAGEECDDGNTRNGDGCSDVCEEEQGFVCIEDPGDASEIVLPIVYRDFVGFGQGPEGHIDMFWQGVDSGQQRNRRTREQEIWVRTRLGSAADTLPDGTPLSGKPIFKWYAGCNAGGCSTLVPDSGQMQPAGTTGAEDCDPLWGNGTGATLFTYNGRNEFFCGFRAQDFVSFSQWYRDVPAFNQTVAETLTLSEISNGVYQFSQDGFWPLDNRLFGNTPSQSHNFHFTSEVRTWFEYDPGANATLTFFGDDDVWVFINGLLVVDISGIHGKIEDSVVVNASTVDIDGDALNLTTGDVYEIVVFQAERNPTGSNYQLTLQDFNLATSRCESTCGDGIQASDEECDDGTNNGDYGTCNDDCTLADFCGDGVRNGPEDCDDGRNNAFYSDAPMSACSTGCVFAPFCGDGEVAVGIEQCDGEADCDDDCTLTARCGDGTRDAGEQCDDGADNGTPDSNCDTSCRTKCGNGEIDPGELCDPGAGNFSSGYGGCLPPVGNQRGCILGPRCGDGVRNGSEACDDGTNDGSYGTCAPMCQLPPRCGDGVLQAPAGELCDNGVANITVTYMANAEDMCTTACTPVGYCGDGAVTNGEGCDDGVNDGTPGSCEADCSAFVPLSDCGDGDVDDGEECDAGGANGTPVANCDLQCRVRCGNGIRDTGEECDDGVNDGRYGTCNPDCSLADFCGDGTVNGPEACDEGDDNEADPYGPDLCTIGCREAPFCGDGRLQSDKGEECDGQPGCTAGCRNDLI